MDPKKRLRIDYTVGDEIRDMRAHAPVPARHLPPGLGGSERAAKLLLALGPEQAAAVLKELGERDIEKLVNDMARIRHISAEERREILSEFDRTLRDFDEPVHGGVEKAREILARSLGEKKADEILARVNRTDIRTDFQFLERMDPNVLAATLSLEHPQIAAVALSCIAPRIAAAIMKMFPPAFQSDVASRIARTIKTHPEALERVAKVLREKFERRTDETYSETGGPNALANILNHMDRSTEDTILTQLGSQSPDIIDNVRELLYTFEELINLAPREMRMLLSKVNDDEIIAVARRHRDQERKRGIRLDSVTGTPGWSFPF
ncbi:MAG: flagellar motor switch protein FliG [Spirochaetia bacterium]|nr:flagellar motor switch protein FliG [Spirochaetia bacterium]